MKRVAAVVLVVALTLAESAHACAVCWGGASDSSMIDGAKMSILFMAILVYTILGGFVAGFVAIGRRAQKLSTLAEGPTGNAAGNKEQ